VDITHIRLGGGIYGGAIEWIPDPFYFPEGTTIAGLSATMGGVPFTAHHRWYAEATPLKDRFEFIVENGWAMSIDPAYWEFIMAFARDNNIAIYEQDWMISHSNHFSRFKTEIGFGETWLREMATAAEAHGVDIQYCMATPAMWMTGIKFKAVSNVRNSNDYHPDWPHTYDVSFFTQSAMLARALGLWPFKDVFFTTKRGLLWGERCPELETVLSALSAGPVAPGDPIGKVNKALIQKCYRADGMLVKTDRPVSAVDVMFTPHAKYYLCETGNRQGELEWHYVLAVNLWPERVKDRAFTLSELGIEGRHVEYDIDTCAARIVEDSARIELKLKYECHALRLYAPLFTNGWAILGDATKFAMMNDLEIKAPAEEEQGVSVTVSGVQGDRIDLKVYAPSDPTHVLVDGVPVDPTTCHYDEASHVASVVLTFEAGGDKLVQLS
jgi:hypothetical protein